MTIPPPLAAGHVIMLAAPAGETRVFSHRGDWKVVLPRHEAPANGCGVTLIAESHPDPFAHL